ncbi:hypothetical protein NPIL_628571, partial [Nephila pilipes]
GQTPDNVSRWSMYPLVLELYAHPWERKEDCGQSLATGSKQELWSCNFRKIKVGAISENKCRSDRGHQHSVL